MPNVGGTDPINPIWPARPGERPEPRKRPKPPEKRLDKQIDKQDKDKSEEHPRVDDYA